MENRITSQIERQHYGPADAKAFEAKSLIAEVIKENIDANVGGDVAAIVLERGHSLRWFSPTAQCHDGTDRIK
jgi:hypothetical protein